MLVSLRILATLVIPATEGCAWWVSNREDATVEAARVADRNGYRLSITADRLRWIDGGEQHAAFFDDHHGGWHLSLRGRPVPAP